MKFDYLFLLPHKDNIFIKMSVSLDVNVGININKNDTIEVNLPEVLPPLGILNESDILNMDREELKRWCGVYGIRRNIKTEEMRIALYNILKQNPVDAELYNKKNRIILTKKKKVGGIGVILVIIGLIIFFSFRGSGSIAHVAQNITNGTYSLF